MTEVEQKKVDTKISSLAADLARSMGIELVVLRFLGSGSRSVLRIDVDRAGTKGITLDECKRFSMALEIALDDRKVIEHAYTLEVSSPGMDRPITTPDDIRRNTGRKVMAELKTDSSSTVRAAGILLGVEDGILMLGPVEDEEGGRFPWLEVVHMKQFLSF